MVVSASKLSGTVVLFYGANYEETLVRGEKKLRLTPHFLSLD